MAAGCEQGPRTTHLPLRIAAAADLQRVLPRLLERFEKQTATTTTLTIDASGRLAEQIKAGAPFDVFLAANVKFVSDLARAGLVEKARFGLMPGVHWSFACTAPRATRCRLSRT